MSPEFKFVSYKGWFLMLRMGIETNVSVNPGSRRALKSVISVGLSVLIAVTPVSVTGCKKSPNSAPGISQQLQNSWPIWSPEDLEINKERGAVVQYDHEMNLRPKFYRGRMPLKFKSQHPVVGIIGGMKCLKYQFNDFSTYFIYDSVWLKGAVAIDNSNTMVAEARFNYIREEDSPMMKLRMEEFHYSDGLLVYHCMSDVDNSMGTKTKETDRSGRKRRDYFFIVSVGNWN